jgi:hypothetical protein
MTYSTVEFTVNVLTIFGLLCLMACARFRKERP